MGLVQVGLCPFMLCPHLNPVKKYSEVLKRFPIFDFTSILLADLLDVHGPLVVQLLGHEEKAGAFASMDAAEWRDTQSKSSRPIQEGERPILAR